MVSEMKYADKIIDDYTTTSPLLIQLQVTHNNSTWVKERYATIAPAHRSDLKAK
jgi:hypothetical protein